MRREIGRFEGRVILVKDSGMVIERSALLVAFVETKQAPAGRRILEVPGLRDWRGQIRLEVDDDPLFSGTVTLRMPDGREARAGLQGSTLLALGSPPPFDTDD